MARYYIIAFLCAPMSVMGGGEARAAERIEEDIEQVYGREKDTISIATGYRKPLDLAPSVANVMTQEDSRPSGRPRLVRSSRRWPAYTSRPRTRWTRW